MKTNKRILQAELKVYSPHRGFSVRSDLQFISFHTDTPLPSLFWIKPKHVAWHFLKRWLYIFILIITYEFVRLHGYTNLFAISTNVCTKVKQLMLILSTGLKNVYAPLFIADAPANNCIPSTLTSTSESHWLSSFCAGQVVYGRSYCHYLHPLCGGGAPRGQNASTC